MHRSLSLGSTKEKSSIHLSVKSFARKSRNMSANISYRLERQDEINPVLSELNLSSLENCKTYD